MATEFLFFLRFSKHVFVKKKTEFMKNYQNLQNKEKLELTYLLETGLLIFSRQFCLELAR